MHAKSSLSFRPRTESESPKKKTTESWMQAGAQAIADESAFLQALYVERKRSERSSRPFLLMLVETSKGWNGSLDRVLHALQSSRRETDICGWYETGRILAIIFNDIGDALADSTMAAIQTRLTQRLHNALTDEGVDLQITFHVFPEPGDKPGPVDLVFYPDLRKRHAKKIDTYVKRTVDIVISLLLLILLSPLLVVIALAIRLTSKGPIFFKQTRVGRYARPFTFLKFRSMYVNCDPAIHRQYVTQFISGKVNKPTDDGNGRQVFKITNDLRVTPIGLKLRKTSMDELPQLWNVLMGDMSLVGPRPPVPYEFEHYGTWHKRRVIEAKPGITGLWQVSGRSRLTFDEMVRLDLTYIRQASLWLDLKILAKTPLAVFSGDGAY